MLFQCTVSATDIQIINSSDIIESQKTNQAFLIYVNMSRHPVPCNFLKLMSNS